MSFPMPAPTPQAVGTTGISSESFRAAMRQLAGAVTLLAASGPDGTPVGMAATAVCSLSAEPATLLVCINRSTSLGRAIAPCMPFSVNILGAQHEKLAQAFGGMLGLGQAGRFAMGRWRVAQAGAPVLTDALVSFSCRVTQLIEHTSHLIVIGLIEHAEQAEGACVQPSLIYHRGAFVQLHATYNSSSD